MIVLVTGPLGSGKSLYTCKKFAEAVQAGKPVATNLDLAPDWAETIAKRNPLRRFRGARAVERKAAEYRRLVIRSDDLSELMSVRLKGTGEGRGRMILDEAHNWMNSRTWSAEARLDLVRFFSQSRKLGWDVYLIAQDAEMLDKQVRVLFEYRVQLRNLAKAKVFGVIPFTLGFKVFLGVWAWHAVPAKPIKRESFTVGWFKNLYDTMGLSHGLTSEDDGTVWLPLDRAPVAEGSHAQRAPLPTQARNTDQPPAPPVPAAQDAAVAPPRVKAPT